MDAAPTLLFILGPAAVGKMTVGMEIARRTGFKVLHNHLTIDLALRFHEHGTPAFHALVNLLRSEILASVAGIEVPGLVCTHMLDFDDAADVAQVETYSSPFRARGSRILYLELSASQEVRLIRNATELRLSEKVPHRDVEWSRSVLLRMDQRYRLNSGGESDGRDDWLRIDNTDLTVEAVAEQTIAHFGFGIGS